MTVPGIRLLPATLFCALLLGGASNAAQDQPKVVGEYDLKANFLCLLLQYVNWPKDLMPDTKNEFVIGVLGKDPFEEKLDQAVAGRLIDGKKIVVRRFKSVDDYQACHLVFIAPAADQTDAPEQRLAALLAKLKRPNPVIVGDTEGLAQKGAFIRCFVNEEKKLRFEVNVDAAKRGGIQFRPEFLRLGKTVS